MMPHHICGRSISQPNPFLMDKLDDKLHIIISGERGRVIRIPCSKRKLQIWGVLAIFLLLCICTVFVGTIFLSPDGERFLTAARQKLAISSQSAEKTDPHLQQKLAHLQAEISALEDKNREQLEQFEQEREVFLGEAMEELSSRSKLLEELFQSVGIIVPRKTKIVLRENENSGGPFRELSPLERQKDELINRIDAYLDKADAIPLGRPSSGRITSPFGKRRDPLNGRISFHDGIDFRGWRGEKIHATASGVVTRAGRFGGYGKYVELRHGNGYETAYAHMQKILVKKGQKIKRGDVIGLIGSTGRSTGPHLHYEIRRNDRRINPGKFIKVASTLKASSKLADKKREE